MRERISYEKPRVRKGWIEKRDSREDLLVGALLIHLARLRVRDLRASEGHLDAASA